MKTRMDAVLQRYGTPALLVTAAGQKQIRVIFHSVSSTAWQNMQRVFSPLGEVPQGKYFCVLPVDAAAVPEDTLVIDGREFLLRRVERMYLFHQQVYLWALCVEKGREDTWGTSGSQK